MIKLVDVSKHFGLHYALKNIDLDVPTGQKLVIIGPSGSGKSTLIRCVNMLEKPSSGQVFVDGGMPQSASSIGLKNIRQRIILCYGAGADLTLDSIADEGTTVVITIPFERTVDPVQNGGRSGPEKVSSLMEKCL